ncbi:hypothetical protein [Ruminococcus flavefaciens]|uniref:hypothetical protein n=1 Tax=Ruminococcus flavefaciens TaxID=1265 RepID=UPI0026F0E6EF|nr:hypothetical protein [Ruminococcus flavefaciens]
MKKNIMSFIKKQWLLIWTVACAFLLLTMYVSAEYSARANTMKKVVVATADQGQMFSSNYLIPNGDNNYQAKYVSAYTGEARNTSTYSVDVFLYNYSTSNIYDYYGEAIYYSIEVELTNQNGVAVAASALADSVNGDATVSVYYGSNHIDFDKNSARSQTISGQILPHEESGTSEKKYSVRFSGNWNFDKDICVRIKTVLTKTGEHANKYKDLVDISRIIGLKQNNSSQSNGWDAYISEIREGKGVSTPDGFNLIVTGSGQATVTIKWKPDKIAINRSFYQFIDGVNINGYLSTEVVCTETTVEGVTNPVIDSDGWATLTINANANSLAQNYRNRYGIQVYKTGSETQPTTDFFAKDKDTSEASENEWIIVNIESSQSSGT